MARISTVRDDSPLFLGPHTTVIRVDNFENMVGWYRETLDLPIIKLAPESGLALFSVTSTSHLCLRKATGEHTYATPDEPKCLVSWPTDNITTTRERLLERGVLCDDIVERDSFQLFRFYDPEGTPHECCWYDERWLADQHDVRFLWKEITMFEIRRRPAMYIYPVGLAGLANFFSGYRFSLMRESGSPHDPKLDPVPHHRYFTDWLADRLGSPLPGPSGYYRVIGAACSDDREAFHMFFRLLDEFEGREEPRLVAEIRECKEYPDGSATSREIIIIYTEGPGVIVSGDHNGRPYVCSIRESYELLQNLSSEQSIRFIDQDWYRAQLGV